MWHSGVLVVTFEHISRFFSGDSIVDFEQVNVCKEGTKKTLDPIN